MAERRGDGGRHMVGNEDRYPARSGGFATACQHLPALCFRSLGESMAHEVGARRRDRRALCRRYPIGISTPSGRRPLSGAVSGATRKGRGGTPPRKNGPQRVPAESETAIEVGENAQAD